MAHSHAELLPQLSSRRVDAIDGKMRCPQGDALGTILETARENTQRRASSARPGQSRVAPQA